MAKRANGEGTYRRLKSGNWVGQIMDGYKPNGKKNIVSFTAPTKGEVQQKIRQYLSEKNTEGPITTPETLFEEWAETWYEDYRTQVQPSTYSNYRYTLNTLVAHFKGKHLSEILLVDINAFLTEMYNSGVSLSKISKCKAMLIQIFSYAEDNNLVEKNIALKAKVIRNLDEPDSDSSKDAFHDDEYQILMETLPDTLLGNSFRVLLCSGIRIQELLALNPSDIAEDGSSINVNKAIKMVDGRPVLGPTKSKKSRRIVPIPVDYRPYVLKLLEQGGKALIWTSGRANLLCDIQHFRKLYYRVLATIPGVRKLSPHCCRHTYITRLEANGVPMQLIARLVGHSNVDTTVGYTHTELATLSQAVSSLNRPDESPDSQSCSNDIAG